MPRRPLRPALLALPWLALVAAAGLSGCGSAGSLRSYAGPAATPREAIERVVPLLQHTMAVWSEKRSCVSCHHQSLGTMALAMARERGVAIDRAMLDLQVARLTPTPRRAQQAVRGEGGINGTFGRSFDLLALAAAGSPRSSGHEALAYYVEGNAVAADPGQAHWWSSSFRPPLEASPVTGTALAIRALSLYSSSARRQDVDELAGSARRWLLAREPRDAEERAMRLFGLGWAGASATALARARDAILAEQNGDGGWAQLSSRLSDAYATGQALVALWQFGGVAPSSQPYRRGVEFLMEHQQLDGSWHVATRRRSEGLPHFETGFPHGDDQFISTAATSWAIMALCGAVDAMPGNVFVGAIPPAAAPFPTWADADELHGLHEATALGTAAEMQRCLGDGADPDAATAEGLRPLHLAVHDVERVRVLLDRGAAIDARTASGHTPLMLACWFGGDDAAARLLLERGADPRIAAGDETALTMAVGASKRDLVRALLEAGLQDSLAGGLGAAALAVATANGDVATVDLLLASGVDPDATTQGETATMLHWAAMDGEAEIVELLLGRGADVDAVDEEGMTALAWAAKIDHGSGAVLDVLLRAGADSTKASPSGHAPRDWAEEFANPWARARLPKRR